MKVKVFKFVVSNWSKSAFDDDKKKYSYIESQEELATEEQIENTINEFISDKENVSITVTPVDVHYHNNGRGNDIELVYTLLYQ